MSGAEDNTISSVVASSHDQVDNQSILAVTL